MQKIKKWEDLTITDDFMFSQVMKDKEIFVRGLSWKFYDTTKDSPFFMISTNFNLCLIEFFFFRHSSI